MNIVKNVLFLGLVFLSFAANAETANNWDNFSDVATYGLVGMAFSLPATKGDWTGFKQAGYSIVTASGIALIGKSVINEERPDKSGDDSFPSNHAASAFAAATTLNLRYGWKFGLPAYGVAALVGYGRVESNKHHWQDVLAGAALGALTGWIFTDAFDENVEIVPWAGRDQAGLSVSLNW